MRSLPSAAGPVDAGPTVFTMRPVFERLFDDMGETLSAHVRLSPLKRLARHHWRGADLLDLHADQSLSRDAIGDFAGATAAGEFDRFCARARTLFDAFEGPVMLAADPGPGSVALSILPNLLSVSRAMAPLSSFWDVLCKSYSDPRLRQLFGRYATYVGGSPFQSPAILALIWQAEAAGVNILEGGMTSLARALESLCKARGVRFQYGTRAASIDLTGGVADGVILSDGTRLSARAILFAGDPAALAQGLLGPGARAATTARKVANRSLSAWVWTFAARPEGMELSHHNVFFADNYRDEFDDLFRFGRLPRDPTLYLCAQDRDAQDRPGQPLERFQIIMNAAANGDTHTPTSEERQACEKRVFTRFRDAGLKLEPPTDPKALTTPAEFHKLFPGAGGALYGTNPHRMNATFERPRARSAVPQLYLAGGAVHPGPGVPMAALSGRHAAAAILADHALTSPSRRTAMRGGILTGSRTTAHAASRSSGS